MNLTACLGLGWLCYCVKAFVSHCASSVADAKNNSISTSREHPFCYEQSDVLLRPPTVTAAHGLLEKYHLSAIHVSKTDFHIRRSYTLGWHRLLGVGRWITCIQKVISVSLLQLFGGGTISEVSPGYWIQLFRKRAWFSPTRTPCSNALPFWNHTKCRNIALQKKDSLILISEFSSSTGILP